MFNNLASYLNTLACRSFDTEETKPDGTKVIHADYRPVPVSITSIDEAKGLFKLIVTGADADDLKASLDVVLSQVDRDSKHPVVMDGALVTCVITSQPSVSENPHEAMLAIQVQPVT